MKRLSAVYFMYIHCIAFFSSYKGSRRVNKKSSAKGGKKNSQLVLRLDKTERDAFVELCKELDTSAAREIRGFIRRFMQDHAEKD